jgi:hypothetical protein
VRLEVGVRGRLLVERVQVVVMVEGVVRLLQHPAQALGEVPPM